MSTRKMTMLATLRGRFLTRFSAMIWMVNLNHLFWGYLFWAYSLPKDCPFPGIAPFTNTLDAAHIWGSLFIIGALLSIGGDFVKNTMVGIGMLVPQQLIVMFGAVEFVQLIFSGDDVRMLLAAAWFVPGCYLSHHGAAT